MYIIIEPQSDAECTDILSILIMNNKKNFTLTDDIQGFANKRAAESVSILSSVKTEPVDQFQPPSPNTISEPEPPIDSHMLTELFEPKSPVSEEKATTINSLPSTSGPIDAFVKELFKHQLVNQEADDVSPTIEQSIDQQSPAKKRRPSIKYAPVQCKVCGAFIQAKGNDWHTKSAHGIVHSNILRYQCPICLYKNRHRSEIARHIQKQHEMSPKNIRIPDVISMSEKVELNKIVQICFPGTKFLTPIVTDPDAILEQQQHQKEIDHIDGADKNEKELEL